MTDHATRQAAIASIIEAATDNALDGDTSAAAITAANAVLAAIKPPPLVWDHPDQQLMYSKAGSLLLTAFTSPKEGVRMWRLGLHGNREYQWFEEHQITVAQSVAQAHADAAFWAQSGLGAALTDKGVRNG